MFRGLTASAFVLAVASVALGWSLGYHSPVAYVTFWSWCALIFLTARTLARSLFNPIDTADTVIRASVLAFAEIVVVGLLLGGIGWIGVVPYSLCLVLAFAATYVGRVLLDPATGGSAVNGGSNKTRPTYALPTHVLALGLALLVFILTVGIVQSPLTLYDSLSYHLVFPARWLQDHAISIVPTPFSDPGQAYQPSNGELFFLWLMLPFHGDLFARIGQVPFLLLAGTALYAIARRSGVAPAHAAYAPLFLFLARPVVEQAVGADVDLVCAAMFLTSLYLGIAAIDSDRNRDWAMWGVSVGLYLGTKYLAVVYLGVL